MEKRGFCVFRVKISCLLGIEGKKNLKMNPVYTAHAEKAYNMYLSGQKVTTLTSYQFRVF